MGTHRSKDLLVAAGEKRNGSGIDGWRGPGDGHVEQVQPFRLGLLVQLARQIRRDRAHFKNHGSRRSDRQDAALCRDRRTEQPHHLPAKKESNPNERRDPQWTAQVAIPTLLISCAGPGLRFQAWIRQPDEFKRTRQVASHEPKADESNSRGWLYRISFLVLLRARSFCFLLVFYRALSLQPTAIDAQPCAALILPLLRDRIAFARELKAKKNPAYLEG